MNVPTYSTVPTTSPAATVEIAAAMINPERSVFPGVEVLVGEHPDLGPITLTIIADTDAFLTLLNDPIELEMAA